MTREPVSGWDRGVIAACAVGALALAIGYPYVWEWSLGLTSFGGSAFDAAYWIGTVVFALPPCLALAAVVLTARPVGTVIALVAGIAGAIANLQSFSNPGMLGPSDYLRWLVWAVLLALALVAADSLAWQRGRFTAGTGAAAGGLVALAGVVVKLAIDLIGPGQLSLFDLPVDVWLSVYGVPALLLVATGAAAGAGSARRASTRPSGRPALPDPAEEPDRR